MPESLDLFDLADRIRGFVGMFAILGVAVFLSDNRRAISGAWCSGGWRCNGASRSWSCGCRPVSQF